MPSTTNSVIMETEEHLEENSYDGEESPALAAAKKLADEKHLEEL